MIRILKYLAIPLLIGAVIGGYLYFGGKKAEPYDFIVAQKGTITQEVSVTGRVKPLKNLGFAFEKTGKVTRVHVSVGDKVKERMELARLEGADVSAQVAQAQAAVDAAVAQAKQFMAGADAQRAKLADLESGLRPEERQLAETKVSNAQRALIDAERSLRNARHKADVDLDNLYGDVRNVLNDAYLKAYDAVNRQTDSLVSVGDNDNPQVNFTVIDQQAEVDAEWLRTVAGDTLSQFRNDISNLSSDYNSLDDALIRAKDHLTTIQMYLNRLNDALDMTATGSLVASTLNTYRGNLNTGRTSVNAAITAIDNQRKVISAQKATNENTVTAAETKIDDAQNAMISAEDELRLKNAGATQEQITAQEAAVRQADASIEAGQAQTRQAQANLQNMQVQTSKTILTSTISGVVTRIDADPGEIASPNVPVIFVITDKEPQLEAQIPEADISKVKIGDKAKVTLDAYGDEKIFESEVSAIDPAEVMVEGVATYKTTFKFLSEDPQIKPGMTANIDISTAKRDGVIAIPQRAVLIKNGEKTVRIVDIEGNLQDVKVETGLRSSDGNIEILSGINESDKVVVFIKGE